MAEKLNRQSQQDAHLKDLEIQDKRGFIADRRNNTIQQNKSNTNSGTIKIDEVGVADDLNNKINVFVTYAWDGYDEHDEKVISFVNFLREKGYNASMDRKLSQDETATNLNKMMIEGIQNSNKVIIILSPKYKEKANTFTGGVGFEYALIIEELKTNNNKFIFASFGNASIDEISPTGIKGREVLDLKKDQDSSNFNALFSKLQNKNLIQFSDVSPILPEVQTKLIKPFKL